MFFNTVPAFQEDPHAAVAALRLHQPVSRRLAAGGLLARPARQAAGAAQGRLPRHSRSRRAASTPAARSPTRRCCPELRLYVAARQARHLRHARRVRPDLRARRSSARRSRVASSWAGPIRIAASTTTACRCRCRSAFRARPICRSAAISCCCCRASCASTSSSCAATGSASPRSSTPATWPRRRRTSSLEAVLAPSPTNPGGICGNGQTPRLSSTVAALQAAHRGRRRAALQDGHRDHPRRRRRARQSHGAVRDRRTPNPDPNSRVAFHISIGESF